MNTNNCKTCSSCGRSWPINTCPAQCSCGINLKNYDYTLPACVRNKKPECTKKAIIASTTVETTSNMEGIRDALVHVTENNTTYYLDSCGNPIITWAGPIDLPDYDIYGNPTGYRRQLISTTQEVEDPATGEMVKVSVMVYYDGQMVPHLMATDDDVQRVAEYAKTEIEQLKLDLDTKQDKLTAGDNIDISEENIISATDTTYKAGNNIVIEYDASQDANVISAVGSGGAYVAGANIQISPTNVISATDTTYSAGNNITINSNNVISATDTTYSAGQNITISNSNVISAIVDLSNYYNKPEIDQLVSDLDSISMEVVASLPTTGLSNVIYLVERAGTTIYDQWVYSSGQWHNVGDTNIDLNDYYTKTEADALLDDKQDKLTYNSEITTLADTQQVSQVDLTAKKVNFFSLSTLWTWIKNKINGGASTIVDTNLTTSRALVSNTSGKVAVSNVTNTELGYLSGVTSAIQTQINDMWKKIYPVGSIYITMSLDNPGTLFGGTWQKIEDRFLLATGSTYNVVNSTGGAQTVTLTRANLPNVAVTASSAGEKKISDLQGAKTFEYKSGGAANKWGLDYGTKELYEKSSIGANLETASNHTHSFNLNGNVTQTSVNKMPPYITVNVWKRTA